MKLFKFLFLNVLAVGALLTNSFGIAQAASANGPSGPSVNSAIKQQAAPVQVKSSGAVNAPVSSKVKSRAVVPLGGSWAVNLSASSTFLWPTQYSTLTATANVNVGPTPYYISIYDETSGTYVVICGTGTTCSSSVTQPYATTHFYVAYISYYPSGHPPAGLQATSSTVGVTWRSVGITLAASPTTLPVGGTTTLTSTTSSDIGPSPFYAEIYDATAGVRIGVCGFGTSCSATTSQSSATTHSFIAYVSNYSTAYPPTGVQATSNVSYVTWSNAGYVVSLSASSAGYGYDTVTAMTNVNVGPTPYYIEIFNQMTGTRVGVCGFGTSCSATVALSFGENRFVAFVSSFGTTLPPGNIQASSNIVRDYFFPIFVKK
jgi:hypothetical protein